MKDQICLSRGDDIQLDCRLSQEQTWEETVTRLQIAVEENKSVGALLSAKQLLKCALFLQEMNAIPLKDLLQNIYFTNKYRE